MTQPAVDRNTAPLPASRGDWLLAIVAFWLATAAITGLLHWVELQVARHALGQLVWFSREFTWMAPIAYAMVMLPGAVALIAMAMLGRQRWVLTLAAGAFTTVGAFGLLLPYSQVSRLASLILAVGVGVAVARAVQDNPRRWLRRSRMAAVASVIAVAAVAPLERAGRTMRESRPITSLPTAPADASNVLVIILDTVRAASMGLYSVTDSTTPRLNEWSRTSAVFDWAFSPAPWTLPSHGSMFTGVWASEQSGDWERALDGSLPTLAERFRDRGYRTGGFVANMHYTAWDSGLERGFDRYEDYLVNWRQLMFSSSYTQTALWEGLWEADGIAARVRLLQNPDLSISPKHAFALKRGNEVTDAFLDWHASGGDRPFFAFLNYYDAHQPYYAPPQFRRFTGQRGLGAYRNAIAFLDAEIDRVLTTLRERGSLDNTLVVVTSDHGELFGFKGLSGHAHNLYLNTVRVPLILRLPGRVAEGVRVTQPVSLRDLAATVLALAAPDAPTLPGTSLAGTWSGSAEPSPAFVEVTRATNIESKYPTSRGDMQSLIDNRFQLIRHADDDRVELYDYLVDSLLEHDLAGTDAPLPELGALRERLLDLLHVRR